MKLIVATVFSLMVCLQAAPVARPFFIPIIDVSTAVGGAGGNGGSAEAVGAVVTGGIGGPAVSGSGGVLNFGALLGGSGVFLGNVANGAAGQVIGDGSITGSFENVAVAGNGGNGGSATA